MEEGVEGDNMMAYDLYGRVLATETDEDSKLRFDATVAGTYMIQIGNTPARRVVEVW